MVHHSNTKETKMQGQGSESVLDFEVRGNNWEVLSYEVVMVELWKRCYLRNMQNSEFEKSLWMGNREE